MSPVYGPAYALSLVRERAAEHEVLEHVDLRCVKPRQPERVGSFEVEPIRVTHSIADATALAIRTEAGLVVHTGDFKFDEAPPDGETFDVPRFEELAREGVDLLFSDSTNIDAAGPTGSEEGVGSALEAIVAGAQQAVVVAMFASNVHRLKMLGEIARRHGRKIVALGRSVSTHARVAQATARSTGDHAGRPYLEWPADLVCSPERARELPKSAILAVATGSQGESAAALARLARGEHSALDLTEGDVVVLSSRVIPGNEPEVVRVMNDLLRRGVELRTLVVEPRGARERPRAPPGAATDDRAREADARSSRSTGRCTTSCATPSSRASSACPSVTVLENGDVATLDGQGLRKSGRVKAGTGARHGRARAPRRR